MRSGVGSDWLRRVRTSGRTIPRSIGVSELVLAGFLVSIVFLMLVPLPALLLDLLIALNFALSLALLLVALYVASASRLAVLPSLLLVATLFRLGLNVSTTRLVLLEGQAGEIVDAFGKVVVGGNLVVGAIVFVVLTLVQFIVVAKGSERVAEVAARFTLDALPGKQMSIDADLRAGTITVAEAQARRQALERESQLYGALDGAMKFVKGDAIAGIAIVAINIVGGLAVGMFQKGMSLSVAVGHYSVLTVGDGIAAQLPSLLVSTTAGLVVTRVPGETAGASLGNDISSQMAAHPAALGITACLLLAVAVVPGLPSAPFLTLGVLAGLASVASVRSRRTEATERGSSRYDEIDREITLEHALPVQIRLGVAFQLDEGGQPGAKLAAGASMLRRSLFQNLGIRVPEFVTTIVQELAALEVTIHISGHLALRVLLPERTHWIDARTEDLEALVPDVLEVSANPNERQLCWADSAGAERAERAGYTVGGRVDFVFRLLEFSIRQHADEFVGVQETREIADRLEMTHPALVAEVLPRLVSLAQLAEVLRRLVREEVSIADARAVFEAIAVEGTNDQDPALLADRVRTHLRRQLTAMVANGRESLAIYRLAPTVEDVIREGQRLARVGGQVVLDPDLAGALISRLLELEQMPRDASSPNPVLVVPFDIRSAVREIIAGDLPSLRVFSFEDFVPSTVLHPLAVLGAESPSSV